MAEPGFIGRNLGRTRCAGVTDSGSPVQALAGKWLANRCLGRHDAGMTDASDDTPARWTAATTSPDMWVDPDDDPREQGEEEAEDERGVVLGYLRRYRLTLEMKCAELTPEQLAQRSVPPSTMSLLGLVRHLAKVEHHWFRRVMAGEDVPRLYSTEADRDADFNGAVADPAVVEEAWRSWRAEVAFAEEVTDRTVDLGTRGRGGATFRDVLVHMIEEYARHCGHADLLRERIDGRTGQ
jgi:uncharacterized damage-inducible protein DinB